VEASLNKQPLKVPAKCATVQDLIDYVEDECIPASHVVSRVLLDGEDIHDGYDGDRLETLCTDYGVVEVFSARTIDLAQEGLANAVGILADVEGQLQDSAYQLRNEDIEGGLEDFSRSMEAINWYVDLIGAVEMVVKEQDLDPVPVDPDSDADSLNLDDSLGMDLALGGADGFKTFASVENLRHKLMDLGLADSEMDNTLMADMVEFELLPIIRIWIDELPRLARELDRIRGAA